MIPPVPSALTLDETVARAGAALEQRGVPAPDALFLMATGVGELADALRGASELVLGELSDCPEPWAPRVLHAGRLEGARVWLLEDAAGDPLDEPERAPWVAAFPVWLAAARGASVCVHASAGTALARPGEPEPLAGALGLARDHLNASGRTPLVGLGASRLGPLFPDLSRLHHVGLRRAALAHAERLEIEAREVVVAATAGPALETPAERRMLALLGADAAVQSLAPALLAAGHAGLAVLAIVALVDAQEETLDVARLLERSRALEPRCARLLVALADDVARAARDERGRRA